MLLLVTGVPTFSFWFILLVVLPQSFVIPLFVATAGAIFTAAFFALIIVDSAKDFLRRLRSIQGRRITKCLICDEALPETKPRGFLIVHSPHYRTVHPEAWAWNLKMRKRWFAAQAVLIVYWVGWIAVTVYEFSNGNYLLSVLTFVPGIFSMVLLDGIRKRKLKHFREEWARKI
jgi:hypothetical protein